MDEHANVVVKGDPKGQRSALNFTYSVEPKGVTVHYEWRVDAAQEPAYSDIHLRNRIARSILYTT